MKDFLDAVTRNESVSGFTLWSLFSHRDDHGFVNHNDGFTLHYPGDDLDMRERVSTISASFSKVSGVREARRVLSPPEITSIEHGTISWRGSAGAASYSVERSPRKHGPWTQIATGLTDLSPPFTDRSDERYWHRVCAFSAKMVASPCSNPQQERLAVPKISELNIGPEWWKHAVIYEIYPRSFQDSNGDGVGDINGITTRLDYLSGLGIDAIWIAPIFPSPQVDFGYDVSDYEAVDPQYGSIGDLEQLIHESQKRKIKVILDLVLNHTSDQHQWFQESRKSRQNPKRNWYIWRDGKVGSDGKLHPPNNWLSQFGGSAWELDPTTGQYYYHQFYKQQPDLNWRNPEVEKAMFSTMRFWLDRGVAGFRLDAVPSLFESEDLKDEPETGETTAYGDKGLRHIYTDNLPEVHSTLRRMRALIDSYPGDRVLIGETYLQDIRQMDAWYGGAAHDELQLPMDMILARPRTLDAAYFRKGLEDIENGIHGSQPLLVFGNHDRPRAFTRYGDGLHDLSIAKILATILLTSRATAMLYAGDELGMVDSPPRRKEDVRDPNGIRGWPRDKGRDGERTPMQWDQSAQAGFSSSSKTWLPIADSYRQVNVAVEREDPQSLLRWYMQLIEMRRSLPALASGSMTMTNAGDPKVLSWIRTAPDGSRILVALNMSGQEQTFIPDVKGSLKVLMTDEPSPQESSQTVLRLQPYSSWIGQIVQHP